MISFTTREVILSVVALAWIIIGIAFYATVTTQTRRQAEEKMRLAYNRLLAWLGYVLMAVLWIGFVVLWVIRAGEP
jgi:glucose uptake protein GlcU